MKFKTRLLILSFCLATVGSSFASASSAVNSNNQDVYEKKIFEVGVSNGGGTLAYTPDIVELERRGPKSFAVASNGDFYILDTIDRQVEVYNQNGASTQTIELPENREFFDIEIGQGNEVYVLNDLGEVLKYKEGKRVDDYKFEIDTKNIMLGLYKNKNNDVIIRYLDGSEVSIESKYKNFTFDGFKGKRNGNNIELSSDDFRILVEYKHSPAGTYPFVATNNGTELVLENEAIIGKEIYVETRVEEFDKKGQRVGSALTIPTKGSDIAIPHKNIYATKGGKVYQMVLNKERVSIYELVITKQKRSNLNNNLVSAISDTKGVEGTSSTDLKVLTVDPSTATTRAQEMVQLFWQYNSGNRTPLTSTTRPPEHLNYAPTGNYEYGIPYSWGGMNGIDTGSSGTYINFEDGLTNGKTAGNIDTDAGYVSSTVGVDCSGFISAAYQFGTKYSTSGFASYSSPFKTISWSNIAQGDIGNRSGSHVWMYMYDNTNSYNELIGYQTYEATTDGSSDVAKVYNRTLSDAQTYTPMTLK